MDSSSLKYTNQLLVDTMQNINCIFYFISFYNIQISLTLLEKLKTENGKSPSLMVAVHTGLVYL